jgi:hypothetical protein
MDTVWGDRRDRGLVFTCVSQDPLISWSPFSHFVCFTADSELPVSKKHIKLAQ